MEKLRKILNLIAEVELEGRLRSPLLETQLCHLDLAVHGAEGEGEGQEDPPGKDANDGEGDDEVDPGNDEDDDSGDDDSGSDTFDKAYVQKLRKEAAENRIKRKEAEDQLAELAKAEMSETERLKAEKAEAESRAQEATAKASEMLTRYRVESEASGLKFHDPSDVFSLLDLDELPTDDEGLPTRKAVKGALQKLAKSKPYLVNAEGGGFDGGGSGPNPIKSKPKEERVKQLTSQGRIPIQ